jgi:hypothetical protein
LSAVVGQRKGPGGANAPPVYGIKKGLESGISAHPCIILYILLEKIYTI